MTLTTQAWGHDGKTYDGKDMRQLIESIFPTPDSGVIQGLATTQQGSPGSTVQVSAGKAVISATGSGLTGSYHVWNDAALNSPTIDPTTTNGRKDRLILRVTSGVPALEVVKGTASGSPAEPAITGDNYIELALITLPGSTTNITNAMITDRRVFATAAGGQILATSATRPTETRPGMGIFETDTGLVVRRNAADAAWLPWGNLIVCTSGTRPTGQNGVQIYETDTKCIQIYDGSGWQQIGPLGAWTTYTPTWSVTSGSVSIGNGTLTGAYTRTGRKIDFWMAWVAGSTTTFGSGEYRFTLPVAPRSVASLPFTGQVQMTDSGTTESFAQWRSISAGSATVDMVAAGGSTPFRVGTSSPWTWANGDTIRISGTYEAAA